VVLDTRLSLPRTLRLFGRVLGRGTVVACGPAAPARRVAALEALGVTVWRLPAGRGGVSGRALLARLAREGAHEVLLESGGVLGTRWLAEGLVDRLALFVAPRLLGAEGRRWLGPLGLRALERARPGRLLETRRVAGDAFLLVEVGS
jgi:diaminohydroxyphosphoribosylaminopyrimidine deaminase/5-amino-6-(5-phosphoribosylamino)uracil reductase